MPVARPVCIDEGPRHRLVVTRILQIGQDDVVETAHDFQVRLLPGPQVPPFTAVARQTRRLLECLAVTEIVQPLGQGDAKTAVIIGAIGGAIRRPDRAQFADRAQTHAGQGLGLCQFGRPCLPRCQGDLNRRQVGTRKRKRIFERQGLRQRRQLSCQCRPRENQEQAEQSRVQTPIHQRAERLKRVKVSFS